MRTSQLFLTGLVVLAPIQARAQTMVRLGVGAVQGTKLLGDRVNPFDELYGINLTQAVAPSIQASVSMPVSTKYRFRISAELNSTTLTVKNGDTETQYEFGKLRTLSFLGMFEGEVVPHLDWQAGFGPIFYLPADRLGLFQDGGPLRLMAAAGLTRRFPIAPRLTLAVSARYDYHQFITKALSDRGFSQYQAIHRGGLFLGVERPF